VIAKFIFIGRFYRAELGLNPLSEMVLETILTNLLKTIVLEILH